MQDLKSKRNKNRYKDTSRWLDAVYRNNKAYIDEKLKNVKGNKKRVFKNLILEQTGYKYKRNLTVKELNQELNKSKNPTKALKKLSRTDIFSSYKERAQQNAYKVIKEYNSIKEIKKISGEKGKFDWSKLEWNYQEKAYRYGKALISFDPSPEDEEDVIQITELSDELMKKYGYN